MKKNVYTYLFLLLLVACSPEKLDLEKLTLSVPLQTYGKEWLPMGKDYVTKLDVVAKHDLEPVYFGAYTLPTETTKGGSDKQVKFIIDADSVVQACVVKINTSTESLSFYDHLLEDLGLVAKEEGKPVVMSDGLKIGYQKVLWKVGEKRYALSLYFHQAEDKSQGCSVELYILDASLDSGISILRSLNLYDGV